MPRFRTVVLLGLAVACGVALLAADRAGATPLIAMQAAASCDSCHVMPDRSDPKWVESNYSLAARRCRATCGSCHVNPDGGMLRTAEGQYYGIRQLPLFGGIGAPLEKGLSLIKSNPFLTFGGDFRFMDILVTDQENKKSPYFFPMQGDIYLGSRLGSHLSLLTQFGLERGGNAAVREVFAMVDRLPYNAYLKFGKFIPPYGHRLEDHTAYIRSELLVDQSNPVSYSSGAEVGVEPLVFYGRFAYLNEDLRPADNTDATSSVYSGVFGWQGLWLQLGGSFLRVTDNRTWGAASGLPSGTQGDRTAYGGYGSVNLWRLTWLFEYDLVQNDLAGEAGDFDEFITFNEINLLAFRGTTFKVRYETLDPNRDDQGRRVDQIHGRRGIAPFHLHGTRPPVPLQRHAAGDLRPDPGHGPPLVLIGGRASGVNRSRIAAAGAVSRAAGACGRGGPAQRDSPSPRMRSAASALPARPPRRGSRPGPAGSRPARPRRGPARPRRRRAGSDRGGSWRARPSFLSRASASAYPASACARSPSTEWTSAAMRREFAVSSSAFARRFSASASSAAASAAARSPARKAMRAWRLTIRPSLPQADSRHSARAGAASRDASARASASAKSSALR